jgi:hypothetical protein
MAARSPCLWMGLFLLGTGSARAGDKLHPRSLDDLKKTLTAIIAAGNKTAEETQALQRLKAYRYLAEIPHEDLTLEEDYNKMCLEGAKLCQKLGTLEHRPTNPGLPEAEFQVAFKGTSRSNLGLGMKTLSQAVGAWMYDSDPGNIERLGHRRWCLNPAMQKTGFGRAGLFTAMYVYDQNRKKIPAFDMICYPARGYMPVEFFGPKHAWSVSLNPKKYKPPAKDFTPKVYRADAAGGKQGEPLKLGYQNVDTLPFGAPLCIIFRPEGLKLAPGGRFVVELDGIVPQKNGLPVTLSYLVEFVKWKG